MTTTTTYIPTTTTTTGNSGEEDPSVEEKDSAPLLLDGQLDDTTLLLDPGWVQATGKEQDQAKKGSCALSSNKKRRSRRGESKGDYCSPTAAPPLSPPSSLHFRPAENSHKVGSEEGPPGGSTTTTTKTGDQQDSSSSSNGQLDLLQLGNDRLQLAPWSSSPTQSACPENRPVAVCAGAEMQPWELGEGWRQIPFSSPNMPSSPPVELLYWPYCRLCMLYFFYFLFSTYYLFTIFFFSLSPEKKKKKKNTLRGGGGGE